MKNAKIINLNVDDRVEKAINNSMDIYLNKLKTGFIDIGLEDTFKMNLGVIIGRELEQMTFYKDERFIVKFESNMPINGNNDYVDIVIEYQRCGVQRLYLMELKFKKITDSAPDLGTVESFIDIYNLDSHHATTPNVFGCYFIFLTNLKTYHNIPVRGTRTQLPMYDGAIITPHHAYTVTGSAAQNASSKYPTGFTFNGTYTIEYHNSLINGDNYWHFILKI